MAAVPSQMLPLGTPAPSFDLVDAVSGASIRSDELLGERGLLVMFICNHCPFVIHIREEMLRVAHEAVDAGIRVVAINTNDEDRYPQDAPPKMRELAQAEGWRFPYLFDADQSVAKAYTAACTPDFFLFDGAGRLFYRGQMDASRPTNGVPVTGEDLRAAVGALIAGQAPPAEQLPSIGCNIKWKPGNAPAYFG